MRRVRSYQRATRRRKSTQLFQAKMLTYLIQAKKHPTRRKNKELY
jgi:hypothetical protein